MDLLQKRAGWPYSFFKYKTGILEKTATNGNTKEVEFAVQPKCLSNFWRTLAMLHINWEINLILTWSEDCVITDTTTQDAVHAQRSNSAMPELVN